MAARIPCRPTRTWSTFMGISSFSILRLVSHRSRGELERLHILREKATETRGLFCHGSVKIFSGLLRWSTCWDPERINLSHLSLQSPWQFHVVSCSSMRALHMAGASARCALRHFYVRWTGCNFSIWRNTVITTFPVFCPVSKNASIGMGDIFCPTKSIYRFE